MTETSLTLKNNKLADFGFDLTPDADGHVPKKQIGFTFFNCLPCHIDQSGTARYFHVDDGQTHRVSGLQYLSQFSLLRIEVIKLGAGDQQYTAFQKIRMEIGISKGYAVRSEDDIGVFKEWRPRRDKGKLYRPVGQFRDKGIGLRGEGRSFRRKFPDGSAGTTARERIFIIGRFV